MIDDGTEITKSVTVDELRKMRAGAFDRWAWDTGSDEDRDKFEQLDTILNELKDGSKKPAPSWNGDGTKLYIGPYQYTLSTAWDISTSVLTKP